MDVNTLKHKVAEGKLREVLKQLQIGIDKKSFKDSDEFYFLSSRLSHLEHSRNSGILSESDFNIERNRITEAILQLIDKVDKDKFENNFSRVSNKSKKLSYLSLIISTFTLMIAIFAGVSEFSGYSLKDIFGNSSHIEVNLNKEETEEIQRKLDVFFNSLDTTFYKENLSLQLESSDSIEYIFSTLNQQIEKSKEGVFYISGFTAFSSSNSDLNKIYVFKGELDDEKNIKDLKLKPSENIDSNPANLD